jgi:DNA modification methylase
VREPYWHNQTATLYTGHPRQVLAEMRDRTVDCIVTNPPPWTPDHDTTPGHDDELGSYGHEPTAALYVAALRRLFAEVHRVLVDDGTLWLTTGDRYATDTGWAVPPSGRHTRSVRDNAMSGLPARSLIGLPWQIAFALQDDGWIVRNAIVWHQPNPLAHTTAEAVADRFPNSYELIFLLVKQKQYWFDLDPIRQAFQGAQVTADPPVVGGRQDPAGCTGASARRPGNRHTDRHEDRQCGGTPADTGRCRGSRYGTEMPPTGRRSTAAPPGGKNPGDVWSIAARPAWPIEVPLRCISAGCRPDGIVLDPFVGVATTGLSARNLGRSFIGIDANPANCYLAKQALSSPPSSTAEQE